MGKGRSVGRSFVDGLHELRPDVIAFQEAVLANGYDQVADLLELGDDLGSVAPTRDAEGCT